MPVQPPHIQLDPSLIDNAPDLPDEIGKTSERILLDTYIEIASDLGEQLAQAEAEIERLEGLQTVEQVKASLLAPYSERVFWFVVGYCAVVGEMLFLAGWKQITRFELSDTILAIIAGSTAVAVIGLIGMVISGLFGGGKKE